MAEQIEAERRATEQYKANLDKEVQAARALAEAEGRIKENRANEDINRRRVVSALIVPVVSSSQHRHNLSSVVHVWESTPARTPRSRASSLAAR